MSEDTTPAKRPVFNANGHSRHPQFGVSNSAAIAEEDALGELMVDSDDEDHRSTLNRLGSGANASHHVPETPRKG